jgi:hypothetical protein
VACDEFVEPTLLAGFGLILVQEGELAIVEDLEELVPAHLLEVRLLLAEVDAEDAAVVAGVADFGRPPFAGLDPFADDLVIGGRGGFALSSAPSRFALGI